MPITIHKLDGSPPSRAVLMTLEILGLNANLVDVNTLTGENRQATFVQKNPAHTVPLLEEGDFTLADSHAIITFLVSKFGAAKRQDLYSSDFYYRATIDQRMYFDASVLFPNFRAIIGLIKEGGKQPTPEQVAAVEDAYGVLENYLESQLFLADSKLTLADVSVVASVSSLNLLVPISDSFPKLTDWFQRLQNTEFYMKANEPGLNQLAAYLNPPVARNA